MAWPEGPCHPVFSRALGNTPGNQTLQSRSPKTHFCELRNNQLRTSYFAISTLNFTIPKFKVQSPKSKVQSPKFKVKSSKSKVSPPPESQLQNTKSKVRSPKFKVQSRPFSRAAAPKHNFVSCATANFELRTLQFPL
jgi:hypothetical protein